MEKSTMSLYCHFYTDSSKGVIKTIKLHLNNLHIRVIELKERIKEEIESNREYFKFESVSKTILSRPLSDSAFLNNYFENRDDIFCKVEINVTPVKSVSQKVIDNTQVKTLTTYSYYEMNDKNTIKVMIPLNDVQNLSKEKILATFQENSCDVKVDMGNGISYYFGVPRLHCAIIPEESKCLTSKDNIVFKLRKAKESDNWASLFRMKFVGDTD
jgi:hypothetical protein